MTRDTVVVPTPAALATSWRVGRFLRMLIMQTRDVFQFQDRTAVPRGPVKCITVAGPVLHRQQWLFILGHLRRMGAPYCVWMPGTACQRRPIANRVRQTAGQLLFTLHRRARNGNVTRACGACRDRRWRESMRRTGASSKIVPIPILSGDTRSRSENTPKYRKLSGDSCTRGRKNVVKLVTVPDGVLGTRLRRAKGCRSWLSSSACALTAAPPEARDAGTAAQAVIPKF